MHCAIKEGDVSEAGHEPTPRSQKTYSRGPVEIGAARRRLGEAAGEGGPKVCILGEGRQSVTFLACTLSHLCTNAMTAFLLGDAPSGSAKSELAVAGRPADSAATTLPGGGRSCSTLSPEPRLSCSPSFRPLLATYDPDPASFFGLAISTRRPAKSRLSRMRPSLVRFIRPAALPPVGYVDPRTLSSSTVPGFQHFTQPCRRLEFEFHQSDIRGEGLRCGS